MAAVHQICLATQTPLPVTLSVDYLVIAGGAGGGQGDNNNGGAGGGGAGGYRTANGFSVLSGTTYTVVVGAGGTSGGFGNASSFSTITSTRGGRGGTAG